VENEFDILSYHNMNCAVFTYSRPFPQVCIHYFCLVERINVLFVCSRFSNILSLFHFYWYF